MSLGYKHTLYASYIGYITQAVVNNLPPLLFVTFQKEFSISLEQIALLISVNFGVQMLVDALAVKFVDRIGYRVCIVAAHAFCAAGLAGLGIFPLLFPDAYAGLVLAMVLSAVGGGLIEVLISPIVQSLPGDEKAGAMSLLHSFYCWGHVAVVLLSTLFFVLSPAGGWYVLPLFWAVVPLLNLFLFTKVPLRMLVEEEDRLPLRRLFSMKAFWLFAVLMICAGASEQGISQWASLFAQTGLQVSKTLGDLLGPCAFAVCMGLSRIFYGRRGAKLNLSRFILCSSVLCVGGYLLTVFAPVPLLSLAGCALCGLSVGIMWPGVFSLSTVHCPQGGTAMFALLALAGDIGCALGPGVIGFVSERTQHLSGRFVVPGGLKAGLLCAALFPALMFLGTWLVRRLQQDRVSGVK